MTLTLEERREVMRIAEDVGLAAAQQVLKATRSGIGQIRDELIPAVTGSDALPGSTNVSVRLAPDSGTLTGGAVNATGHTIESGARVLVQIVPSGAALIVAFLSGSIYLNWTPDFGQGIAVSETIVFARWCRVGNRVHAQCLLNLTSGGNPTSAMSIVGLPVNHRGVSLATEWTVGTFRYADVSVPNNPAGTVLLRSDNAAGVRFLTHNATNYFGTNPAVTAANGDSISLSIDYEALAT